MCDMSAPLRPNWFMLVAAISAASATPRPPAAARSSAPASPPESVSAALTPALASASVAAAASVAENTVSAPASIAAWRSASRLLRASSPVAATALIAESKSANFFPARPAIAVRPSPSPPILPDSAEMSAERAPTLPRSFSRPWAPLRAFVKPVTAPFASTVRLSLIDRSAMTATPWGSMWS